MIFRNLQPLVLASASPRRRELLDQLGVAFTVTPADISEELWPDEAADDFVARLAREKAQAVAPCSPESWVLAADTVVVLDGEILGKPEDGEHAEAMLGRLSGRWHRVLTGFSLLPAAGPAPSPASNYGAVVATEVRFAELSRELIAAYVATGEPLDKAGAYGIQGMGGVLVSEIKGSPSNVIGLPLNEVTSLLLQLAVITW